MLRASLRAGPTSAPEASDGDKDGFSLPRGKQQQQIDQGSCQRWLLEAPDSCLERMGLREVLWAGKTTRCYKGTGSPATGDTGG